MYIRQIDLTVRWKWEPGSVAFWDNRVVDHRAVPEDMILRRGEGKRTAIYGEKPFYDPENSLSLSEWIAARSTGRGRAVLGRSTDTQSADGLLAERYPRQ